jgi:hypothetical protein
MNKPMCINCEDIVVGILGSQAHRSDYVYVSKALTRLENKIKSNTFCCKNDIECARAIYSVFDLLEITTLPNINKYIEIARSVIHRWKDGITISSHVESELIKEKFELLSDAIKEGNEIRAKNDLKTIDNYIDNLSPISEETASSFLLSSVALMEIPCAGCFEAIGQLFDIIRSNSSSFDIDEYKLCVKRVVELYPSLDTYSACYNALELILESFSNDESFECYKKLAMLTHKDGKILF